ESLLGAWLVLARLVEDNATAMRAVSVPVHLVNTLLLLAALTAVAWIVSSGKTLHFKGGDRKKIALAAVGLLVLGATGAIAALADTLFPSESFSAGLAADFDTTAHFLTRLRVIHPILAVIVGLYLIYLASKSFEKVPRYAGAVIALVVLQLLIGVINVALLTPITVQVLHLLVADLLWIAVLLMGAELSSQE
ncbi:MAG: COX15/CtaA family protein, partial [Kofleriaceae bacterium]|nr:COX15/CtaA family protein [Kofleriaceae bacterium]